MKDREGFDMIQREELRVRFNTSMRSERDSIWFQGKKLRVRSNTSMKSKRERDPIMIQSYETWGVFVWIAKHIDTMSSI
jgi:hypothetical protein